MFKTVVLNVFVETEVHFFRMDRKFKRTAFIKFFCKMNTCLYILLLNIKTTKVIQKEALRGNMLFEQKAYY